MKLLFFATYYYPYISGITTYPRTLFTHLAHHHSVTILTFPHQPLPSVSSAKGITIQRMPYLFRLSKGFLSPQSLLYFWRHVRTHDLIILNIPNFEGFFLALIAKLYRKPILSLFHCQVFLQNSLKERLINFFLNLSVRLQLNLSDRIIIYTHDYFQSLNLPPSLNRKTIPILPPIRPLPFDKDFSQKLKRLKNDQLWIGFVGRLAREKGIEHLIVALSTLKSTYPNLNLVVAGPSGKEVIGEFNYTTYIQKIASQYDIPLKLLGTLEKGRLGSFYRTIDLLALPSINQTEAFGLVQVESMLAGTPVIASDLPGVRVPVKETGMGLIVPPANSTKLAHSIKKILQNPEKFASPDLKSGAKSLFDYQKSFQEFENLIHQFPKNSKLTP